VIRDGMGQSQVTNRQGAADTVITNALIVDHWGIVAAPVPRTAPMRPPAHRVPGTWRE